MATKICFFWQCLFNKKVPFFKFFPPGKKNSGAPGCNQCCGLLKARELDFNVNFLIQKRKKLDEISKAFENEKF